MADRRRGPGGHHPRPSTRARAGARRQLRRVAAGPEEGGAEPDEDQAEGHVAVGAVGDLVQEDEQPPAGDHRRHQLAGPVLAHPSQGGLVADPATDHPALVVGNQPTHQVEEDPGAAGQGEHHEGDTDDDRVDGEVSSQSPAQAGEDLVLGRPGEAGERRGPGGGPPEGGTSRSWAVCMGPQCARRARSPIRDIPDPTRTRTEPEVRGDPRGRLPRLMGSSTRQ